MEILKKVIKFLLAMAVFFSLIVPIICFIIIYLINLSMTVILPEYTSFFITHSITEVAIQIFRTGFGMAIILSPVATILVALFGSGGAHAE